MDPRTVAMLAIAVASLPAAAAEPAAPSAELLEYLGSWNGDEDWLHSDEVVEAESPPPRGRVKGVEQDRRADPAPAPDRTEQAK